MTLLTHIELVDKAEKGIYGDIAKLIAFHKEELLANIRILGFILPDTNNITIVNFVVLKASEKNVADMLASMIYKYKNSSSNASGIWGGISNVITDVFSQKEKTQQKREESKQTEIITEIEKQKTEQERLKALAAQEAKLSKKTWLLVAGAATLVIIIVLSVTRRNKVQPIQPIQA
jgi:hypothetical protein